ncbi:MAG TPA: carbonate dehydratase [Elusimicrobia bacterium]|nr:carbonate dehydratase [Elusimicrobiota bacterium]HBT62684.1 carbonate dehydratase [Elusimicrobiota bacterium]
MKALLCVLSCLGLAQPCLAASGASAAKIRAVPARIGAARLAPILVHGPANGLGFTAASLSAPPARGALPPQAPSAIGPSDIAPKLAAPVGRIQASQPRLERPAAGEAPSDVLPVSAAGARLDGLAGALRKAAADRTPESSPEDGSGAVLRGFYDSADKALGSSDVPVAAPENADPTLSALQPAAPVQNEPARVRDTEKPWHSLPVKETLDRLGTSAETGLSPSEAERRLKDYGSNTMTVSSGKPAWQRLLLQFKNPLFYILIVSAVLTGFMGQWVDAAIIFSIVLGNGVMGFIQEDKAVKALESLQSMVKTEATVIRGGERSRIPSSDLVFGDVILLEAGDKVPADIRLLDASELRTDESMLTGESLPVTKADGILDASTPLADRTNMAYAGTLVIHGVGRGAIMATGDKTEMGRVSGLIAGAVELSTPLTSKIAAFSRVLTWIIMGLTALTIGLGLLHGGLLFEMFVAAVALAVGAIPEGLPAAITIILAIGVSRMARRRAIIRKLPAVETLGSTTIICSDKTGTLTENQMTVQNVYAAGRLASVTGAGYDPKGDIINDGPVQGGLRDCLLAGLLCNDARLKHSPGGWIIEGDPTEGALVVAAGKAGLAEELRSQYPRLDAIAFESERQYMATLHAAPGGGRVVYMKGAIEKILERCSRAAGADGKAEAFDPEATRREAEALAAQGLRVLALARLDAPAGQDRLDPGALESGLTFLGLQAMMDPVRPEALKAVAACRRAGIRVKMITGDHSATAAAVARRLNLTDGEPRVIDGRALKGLTDAQFDEIAAAYDVFARVEPEQKLRLVRALQGRGEVVAMTGDGVNDAPALKQADIGIAMAQAGTEVAKNSADMLLTDDNFATIEAAVEEGRGVFANLVKFISWTLPVSIGPSLILMAAIVAGTTLPLLPIHVLFINLATAALLGISLAFEPKEPGLMDRPPRRPKSPLLSRALITRILLVSAWMFAAGFGVFEWQLAAGASIEAARTAVVNVVNTISTFFLFNSRTLDQPIARVGLTSNPWALVGAGAMFLLQVLFTHLPFMNAIFHTAPLGPAAWAATVLAGMLMALVIEAWKWLAQRPSRRPASRPTQQPQ